MRKESSDKEESVANTHFVEFEGEQKSNELRRRIATVEPRASGRLHPRWLFLIGVRAVITGPPKVANWPISLRECWSPILATTRRVGGKECWTIWA